MGKRLFDLLLSGLGLLLLAPLLLGLAAWVRLDSPGPALFRQERVGQHGRRFRIHKFRTMRTDAGGLPLTVGVDPRITRAGHFLRRHKLDELPQLIDVFKGDMSLVGPRPEVPRYVALYPAELRDQALAVRPGITDPASLAHLDEAAVLAAATDPERDYIERVLPAKLAAAVAYSQQATLASDLRLLARTVWTLLTRTRPS
ncbi:sugar transferase [Inhella proteolytica]|uniref:Sugar transferase n=1 Tax=Inhella proteolytica TaxID=2795029 RepID=A0A931J7Z7_9BURK|nr:sugar transferase [Inhella proteolytica]MBH9578032.1 sugar transferase [Inhella proteolytica]